MSRETRCLSCKKHSRARRSAMPFSWRFSVPTPGKTLPADTAFQETSRGSVGALYLEEDQPCPAVALEGYPSRTPCAYLAKKRAVLGLLMPFLEVSIHQSYHYPSYVWRDALAFL